MMSVEDAKVLKIQLEEGIMALISGFESKSGLHVDAVCLHKVDVIGLRRRKNEWVRVEVLL